MRRPPSWSVELFHLVLVVSALLAMNPTLAVEQTGDIIGTVSDEKDQPLPGAVVTLSGDNLQGERAMSTAAKGEFAFRALPPGRFRLKINAPGYQVIEQENVTVHIGRTTTLPFKLTAGQMTESVKVIGAAPLVDPIRTTSQDNYGTDYLENVPVGSGGRDYLGVISNSAATGPGDGANPTVRGSTIGGNVYLVDGVDSTDPVTSTFGTNFIYDAIQEVQFQTGGFNAEFGRATGGIVNVVTKSGGNSFSGSVDTRYRNEAFNEKGDHFDPDAFDIDRRLAEGTFGGPMVRDKLWFFLAGSYLKSDLAGEGFENVASFKGRYYLGKLTWNASANHKFILQMTGDPATIDNVDAGAFTAGEATSKQTQGSKFVTGQYTGVLSSHVIFTAQASFYKSRLDVEPQSGDLSTIGHVNFFTGRVSRNAIDAQFSDRFRDQANASLTWNKNDLAGDHAFKFGFDVQKLKFTFHQFTPGGEFDQVCFPSDGCPGNPTVLVANVDHPAGELSNRGLVTAYFAQDEWRIHPRLTFNAGLRYDTFSYDDDRGKEAFSASLLQPRLGIAWNATGDSKNVFKVYGGRFGDPSLVSLSRVVNSRANSTDVFVNENFFGDLNGDGTIEDRGFFGTFGGPGGSIFAHGGNLKATSVVEYQASYERQLGPSSAVGLTLVRRKTHDIIEDRLDPRTGVYVIDNLAQADRNYYGAELRYSTRWKKLYLSSSYTWSRSRGNVEYTQSLGSDFDFDVLSVNRYGYLSDDTRHDLKINGYHDLPWKSQVGFAYQYVSGFPWEVTQSAIPYGAEFLSRRGGRRLPDQHRLDVDLRKGFAIGRTNLEAILSVLNVFDTEIVVGVLTSKGQAGEAIAWQTPRRYEIGFHFSF